MATHSSVLFFFFLMYIIVFIYLLAILGLHWCMDFSLVAASRGYVLVVVHFSLQWLLLLLSIGTRVLRLQ